MDEAPVEFTNDEWKTMEKVLKVLQPFRDATDMLSYHDASVSMVIPFVTTILASLTHEDRREEHGVLTLKRRLKTAMETRFGNIENIEEYTVATLLDSKYKGSFFRSPDTLDAAKNVLTERLVESLRKEGSSHDQVNY